MKLFNRPIEVREGNVVHQQIRGPDSITSLQTDSYDTHFRSAKTGNAMAAVMRLNNSTWTQSSVEYFRRSVQGEVDRLQMHYGLTNNLLTGRTGWTLHCPVTVLGCLH